MTTSGKQLLENSNNLPTIPMTIFNDPMLTTLADLQRESLFTHLNIKNATPIPAQLYASTLVDPSNELPVGLRLERLNVVMAIHTEAQCRGLARAVRHECRVQITVLPLVRGM